MAGCRDLVQATVHHLVQVVRLYLIAFDLEVPDLYAELRQAMLELLKFVEVAGDQADLPHVYRPLSSISFTLRSTSAALGNESRYALMITS